MSITIHESVPRKNLDALVSEVSEFAYPKLRFNRSIVSCIGAGMAHQVGIAAKVFGCLEQNDISIEMIAQGKWLYIGILFVL